MLIDVTRLVNRTLQGRLPTGIDRVSLAYLNHYGCYARAMVRFGGRWVKMNGNDSRRLFDALLVGGMGRSATIRRSLGQGYALAWRRHRGAILLNTGHSGLDRAEYLREIKRQELRPLFFLHDLIPISHPEFSRSGETDKHHRRLEVMLSAACGLIVNSAATRDDLLAYSAEKSVAVPPCVIAPLAPARLPPPDTDRPLAEPYFVCLGTIEPRKNHLLLLHLWRQLVEEFGDAAPRLVVIGQRGWECEQVVDLLERCQVLRGYVEEKPSCPDEDLATWLHHSRALLFPSFVEGFGIPLVEALALGVPVIASDLAVFREIAGDIPEYLDPLDGPGWRRLIIDYLSPASHARQAQIERMRNFDAPSWERHFSVVDDLLVKVQACS